MLTNAQRTYSEFGQSIWYDNVRKSALDNGDFARLISFGVRGCTSNPAIFHKSIAGSTDYDTTLRKLVAEGHSVDEIYERLAVEDIQKAADALLPVFEESNGADGHVSIEVHPRSAHDVDATVREALHLSKAVGRANLMIKVPATDAGLTAITALIGQGVSVNVTLIFSCARYVDVAKAYIAGLQQAKAAGLPLSNIASVASFFISRIDSAVDEWLQKQTRAPGKPDPASLLGKIAIANAKEAYAQYEQLFSGESWASLRASGARPQRLLWASTSTKNPSYPDTLYVDELIGRDTVNTVPPATLVAFQEHGTPKDSLSGGLETAREQLRALTALGLDLERVCDQLLREGVDAFVEAMDALLESIATRRQKMANAESAT